LIDDRDDGGEQTLNETDPSSPTTEDDGTDSSNDGDDESDRPGDDDPQPPADDGEPPVAKLEAETTEAQTGQEIRFDASASSDPDGGSLSFEWTLGDDATNTGATITHAYRSAGEYDVSVTVTDGDDRSNTATTTISVTGPDVIGETGVARFGQQGDEWTSVSVDGRLDDPVVVTGPPQQDGTATTVRGRALTSEGFELQYQDWSPPSTHSEADVPWLAMDAGAYSIDGAAVRAGSVAVDEDWTGVTLPANFTETPIVLANRMSDADEEAAAIRLRNVSADGFDLRLQEKEAADGSHPAVTVHYVAVEPVNTDGLQAGTVEATSDSTTIGYDEFESPPATLATIRTFKGPDTATLRHLNRSAESVEVFVQEETSDDDETDHISETVGWLAASPGSLNGIPRAARPTAEVSVTPSTPWIDETVRFDATASNDVDGRIVEYAWEFGDGATATGDRATHVYETTGEYEVTLTVTDDEGATAEHTTTLSVEDGNYLAQDRIYNMDNPDINRATSQHFQLVWGPDGHSRIDDSFIQGNLENLEQFWDLYVNQLEFTEPSRSRHEDQRDGNRYKMNVYITNTGLSQHESGWAFQGSRDGFGHLVVHPNAMRVDPPSGTLAHEFGHVLTMHADGGWFNSVMGPWWEGSAEWFKGVLVNDRGGGGAANGLYQNANLFQCHGRNEYDSWPIFMYLHDDPDDLAGYGEGSVARLMRTSESGQNLWEMIDQLASDTSAKECLGHFAKRLPTQDFEHQDLYRRNWEDLIDSRSKQYHVFSELEPVPDRDDRWRVPIEQAPQQSGWNIVELEPESGTVSVTFDGLVNGSLGSDWRAALVAEDPDGTTRYSQLFGDGETASLDVGSAESVYLTVAATPDTWYDVTQQASESDQPFQSYPGKERLPYEVRISGATPARTTSDPPNSSGSRHPNGGGFVADSATIADSAFVGPNAIVKGNATVEGTAEIRDYAVVNGGTVTGNARVLERAIINGTVRDDAIAKGTTVVEDTIEGEGVVDGDFAGDNNVTQGTVFGHTPNSSYVNDRPHDPGLLLAYDFEEAHDVYALDRYGVDHGILRGDPSVSNGALELRDPGQYVLLEDYALDYDDLRIDATVTWDGSDSNGGDQHIWALGASESRQLRLSVAADGSLRFRIENGDTVHTVTADQQLSPDTQTSVRVTIQNGTATIHVDGTEVASGSVSLTPNDLRVDDPHETPHQNYVGRGISDSTPAFTGVVHAFAMYRPSRV